MSHFFLIALMPDGTDECEIPEVLETLMSPYDESRRMAPYMAPCSCIGYQARSSVRSKLDAEGLGWDDLRNSYQQLPESEQTGDKWQAQIAPREKREAELLELQAGLDSPDADCEECHGTGKRQTTYNPDSKWDWYVVGGRWNGEIKGEPRDDADGGFNFGSEFHGIEENSCRVEEICKGIPFAILTPEGEWIERGKMGWWGMTIDEKDGDEWAETVKRVFEKYAGHLAVGVDCHI